MFVNIFNFVQVLVGRVECCEKTGYLTISDSTASIPLIPVLPLMTQQQSSTHSPTNLPLNAVIGSTVLLSGVTVYVEKMTPGFLQSDSNTTSHLIYISAGVCTPIVSAKVRVRESTRTNGHLYFCVMNKNCVVVRQPSLMFSAHTMMGESLEMLREKGEEVDGNSEPPVEVALSFTEEAFKWYSYVINGGIYSLKSHKQLSSLKELADSGFLQVTSDIKLECVGYSLPQQVMYDTTDLIDTANLPGFIRSKENIQQKKYIAFLFELCFQYLNVCVYINEYKWCHFFAVAHQWSFSP